MATKVFLNIPVTDLKVSRNFYKSLGYTINDQFSDEGGACVVVSDTIYFMILTHAKFKQFAPHPIMDPRKASQVLISLSCESKQEVMDIVGKALKAGGTRFEEPTDHGFMYSDSFLDPDGNGWGYFYMDMSQAPKG